MVVHNTLSALTECHFGGHNIVEIYNGEHLVWPVSTPPVPPSNWKAAYTTNSGTTYYIPCDSSTTLTRLELTTSISDNRLSVSSVTDVEIGTCVTTIGDNLCNNFPALTGVTIPNTVTTIEWDAFRDCPLLPELIVPSGITSIPSSLVDGDFELTTTNIPDGVTSIGVEAYMDCLSLLNITIPSSVTSIDDDAFGSVYWEREGSSYQYDKMIYMNEHRTVTCLATIPPTLSGYWNEFGIIGAPDVPFGDMATYPIYVPAASLNDYKTEWSYYADRIFAIPNE